MEKSKDKGLRYLLLPVTCGRAIDKIAVQSGIESSAWIFSLLLECANQQLEEPVYCVDITTDADLALVARRCHFDKIDDFRNFVQILCEANLFIIVKVGEKRYLASEIVTDSAIKLAERKEKARKAAKARWGDSTKDGAS